MTENNTIPPTRQALAEALALSSEILRNTELSELPLSNIALKTSRLARLLNDFDFQKIMEYEVSGYPTTLTGMSKEVWDLAVIAGRSYEKSDTKTNEVKEYVYRTSINELEDSLRISESAIAAARDPDISVSSANPYQSVHAGIVNRGERQQIRNTVIDASQKLASRKSLIYHYALRRHYELKYSGIADDIFVRVRQRADESIGLLIPDAVQKLSAVYDSLLSDNSENWSNAVHSCRRILQDLADVLFPATPETRTIQSDGKPLKIKLGKEQYINRIMAFVEDASDSGRFQEVVGSHLSFLGNRLDSVFKAAQKGSHDVIISRQEADRYVVYTYLVVGDILSLYDESLHI